MVTRQPLSSVKSTHRRSTPLSLFPDPLKQEWEILETGLSDVLGLNLSRNEIDKKEVSIRYSDSQYTHKHGRRIYNLPH